MLFRLKLSYLLLFFSLSAPLFAQRTITGTVTDSTNIPIIGASIIVEGTSIGTFADIDGKYSIKVPVDKSLLTFSSIGFKSISINITDSDNINVKMSESPFDDWVITTCCNTSKELSFSRKKLNHQDFNQGNISNVLSLVQGRFAGLTIATPEGGNHNQLPQFRMRGISTFSYTNPNPLIVVDGVPNYPLNLIDPNDVASIEIIRDATTLAYGAQTTNGVVAIRTKRSSIGSKTTVSYSVQASAESVSHTVPVMSADEYIRFNLSLSTQATEYDKGAKTNWYDEISRKALSNVHNLAISGSTKTSHYRASLNWRDHNGVAYDGFKQLNARAYLEQRVFNDRLSINLNFAATQRKVDYVNNNIFDLAVSYRPTAPVKFSDLTTPLAQKYGGYFETEGGYYQNNPKAIQDLITNTGNQIAYSLSSRATLKITEGVNWATNFTLTKGAETQKEYISRYSFWAGGEQAGGVAKRNTADKSIRLLQSYLNYDFSLGNFDMDLATGYQYERTVDEKFGAQASGFLSDIIGQNSIGSASGLNKSGNSYNSYEISSSKEADKYASYFGKANFNWKNTLDFNIIVREEGSSKLAVNHQWRLFPVFSTALDINRILDLGFTNTFQLRSSYGITGNLPIERYGGLAGYRIGRDSTINSVRNPVADLTWEKKKELNIGLDFSLLKGLIYGSFDAYQRQFSDLYYGFNPPPGIFEYYILLANIGKMQTKGFDFTLNYYVLPRKSNNSVNWQSSFVLSHFSTKLISLSKEYFTFKKTGVGSPGYPCGCSTTVSVIEENKPLGNFYGFEYAGVSKIDGVLAKNIKGESIKIWTADENDFRILGNGLPKLSLGFTNSLSYKNLDVQFFVRGLFGHDIVNTYRLAFENANPGSTSSFNRVKTKYWNPDIRDAVFSSNVIEKGSFINLENLTISYFINRNDNFFNKTRLFVNANNLIKITGYTGMNPDIRFTDYDNAFVAGLERRTTYFDTRSFTIGGNFDF